MTEAPSRRGVWYVVALCYLAMMSLAIAVNLLPVFLTTLKDDFGSTPLTGEQLGRIGAVTFLGLVAGILIAGPLADRKGAKPFVVGGNLLIGAGLLTLSQSGQYAVILTGSFVMGFGAGALDMILSPIVAALQPHRKTLAMNLLHSFYCIGAVATIFLSSVALRVGVEWRLVAMGLLPMPVLIAIGLAMVKLPPMVAEQGSRTRTRDLMRQPIFIALMIAIFLGGSTELGMAYWLPAYAEKTLGFSQWTSGMAFVGFSLAMAIGRLAIVFVPKSLPTVTLMIFCCIATTILFPIASFSGSPQIALAACVAAGFTGSCLWPSTLALSADRYPNGGATMFAVLAALGNFGGIFMPWVVGAIADRSDLRWGLATATLCPLLMVITLLWLRSRLPSHSVGAVPAVEP